MDPVKILKRAWHILWNYRALWVFGLILALSAAGSSGGNATNGSGYNFVGNQRQYDMPLPDTLQERFKEAGEALGRLFEEGLPATGISQDELIALPWIFAAFVFVMLALGFVLAIARYVSETAVIRMVDKYEKSETKMSVRQGFRIGWSRTSWRLFLINLIINLPGILLLVMLVIAGFFTYIRVEGGNGTIAIAGLVPMIGVLFLVIFIVAIASIFLRLLRHFAWRVCALEDVGVREALQSGFKLARRNWQNVGLMWLIMMGLGITWMVVSVITVILTIPVVIVTSIAAAITAAIPGLLLVGFFSLFLSGYLPWIVGILFVLPLFVIMAFSPWILLNAWRVIFISSVWTLTYRRIKALTALTANVETEPAGD